MLRVQAIQDNDLGITKISYLNSRMAAEVEIEFCWMAYPRINDSTCFTITTIKNLSPTNICNKR